MLQAVDTKGSFWLLERRMWVQSLLSQFPKGKGTGEEIVLQPRILVHTKRTSWQYK